MIWHVITGEYPPDPGGVSDYTRAVARGLAAAGDSVVVWTPGASQDGADGAGIVVRRLPDRFGRASRARIDSALDGEAEPHRVLVQYVPHAFGWKALNLPFCWWLKSRRRDSVWVMFHEVAVAHDRRQGLSQNFLALVTRRMAAAAASAAERTFVSIPAWTPMLRGLGSSANPEWLPVPSGIPIAADASAAAALRERVAPSGEVVAGHFGTFGGLIVPLLAEALPVLLERSTCRVFLLGRGSESFRAAFVEQHPRFHERVGASGELAPRDLSAALAACDFLLQPYPDGITSRRTSAMAGLQHGKPLVTTDGWLTEPFWRSSSSAILGPARDVIELGSAAAALAADRDRIDRMSVEARALYDARFELCHTIAALRAPVPAAALEAVS